MEQFGTLNGKPVELIRLREGGLSCEILTYGATLRKLTVPDREGKPRDVVLGFDTLEEYINHGCYFGAVIGPVANRIGGARCKLNGKVLKLPKNDGENSLHSGEAGFDRQLWEVMAVSEEAVTLVYTHPDGLGGIPGELRAAVTYWLEEGSLQMEYLAISEADTLCNLTNHSYFNLEGHDSGPILDHRITLYAKSYTPTDAHSIPTGAIRAVGGPMDLTRETRIGDHIDDQLDQLRDAGGYDHNWVVNADEGMGFRPAALVKAPGSGISMTVMTDRPGVQFYTGNYIPEGLKGKEGAVYHRRQGLCLETQAFPDAPHHASFPSILLRAGREWHSRTAFVFKSAGL